MAVHRALLALLALLAADPGLAAAAGGSSMAVVSYLPEWRYEGANWDTICEHSSHLLLFSLEPAASGDIVAHDRLPRKDLLALAREAALRHDTWLLACFGGNGRSAGFSQMVRSKKSRRRFVKELVRLLDELGLDGVDYNWEYPGYSFRTGWLAEEEIAEDYKGLSRLIRDTRRAFDAAGRPRAITMAYYPDVRQEQLIKQYGIDKHADLLHMMSYDQGGGHHSTLEFGRNTADQGLAILPPEKLTLGLPFYGRHSRTGDWTTYEDLVRRHDPLPPGDDYAPALEPAGASIGFNGVSTIEVKTRYALEKGLAGVMIWEVGQDCRLEPVRHGEDTHVRTCPADNSSLLLAVSRAAGELGRARARKPAPGPAPASDEL